MGLEHYQIVQHVAGKAPVTTGGTVYAHCCDAQANPAKLILHLLEDSRKRYFSSVNTGGSIV